MNSKYQIEFSAHAIYDLRKIKHYLDGYKSSIFISFYDEFTKKVNLLEEQPKIFEKYPSKSSVEYRRFFVKKYAVIYEIDENKKMVYIHSVYHCKENYWKLFFQRN